MSRLDDILEQNHEGFTNSEKADIKALVLELIGEDENVGVDPEWPLSKVKRRDDFRAELRQKVEEL
jgi:hypothetical protein